MRMLREYDRPVALIAPRRAAFSAAFWMLAIGADATAIVLASMATGVRLSRRRLRHAGQPRGLR